jgi:sulfite exporter TauE/SafE
MTMAGFIGFVIGFLCGIFCMACAGIMAAASRDSRERERQAQKRREAREKRIKSFDVEL